MSIDPALRTEWTTDTDVALIKASGIYIVVMASSLPIPRAEVISRHHTWGAAAEARQRLLGAKRAASKKKAAPTSTWI